jgi:hypothetical protein
MTRTIIRSLALLGFGLALTACAQHDPAQANCFTFRDAPAQFASAQSASARPASATTTISTMGAGVPRRDSPCEFVMLGAGG